MSATELEVREAALEAQQRKLRETGKESEFNLWRESLPEGSLSDMEAFDVFFSAQEAETAAVEGRLSVSSGGEVVPPDTDIPTPGPDDEEGSPDGAGDTSKGASEPGDLSKLVTGAPIGDELKVIPGMWVPPKEAEAENYEAPSTADMSQSEDWIKDARIFWEYMGSPNTNKDWVSGSGNIGTWQVRDGVMGGAVPEMSDTDIGEWAKHEMSMFNWNVASTMNLAHRITTSNDPKLALSFLNLINMYDHSDGGAAEFGNALAGVGTDPTSYLGLGVGSVAAKGAAKMTAKKGLSKMLQTAIVGATAGAVEGGSLAGGFDLTVQNIEQEAGARDELDYGQAAKSTGIGIGFGATLGGSIGGFIGRKADKLAAAVDAEMARLLGGERVERLRQSKGESVEELIELLQASERASAAQGQREAGVTMVQKYLNQKDRLPLKADGTLDEEQVALELIEMQKADRQKILDETAALDDGRTADPTADDLIQYAIDRGESIESVGTDAAKADDLIVYVKEAGEELAANDEVVNQAIAKLSKEDVDIGTLKAREEVEPPSELSKEESAEFAARIAEMHARAADEVQARTPGLPGSYVKDVGGALYEVMGRTKNGWYHLRHRTTGKEVNMRRKQFDVVEVQPKPDYAGPMEMKPFTTSAARIMAMNEQVVSGKLREVKTTHKEQLALAKELQEMGIDITEKEIATHWTPSELAFLRQTYNDQANGMAELARRLESDLRNDGRLTDEALAMFNEAHTQFVATRDLFFGVSGNAARQLNILRSRPTDDVYEFSQSLMDSISLQGGRANTERAIRIMADFARRGDIGDTSVANQVTKQSQNIWGNKYASALLNVRYNAMLSSWRTHFFNFLGNSASGVYHHLMISPIRMGINNFNYARQLALSVIDPRFAPDPADRMTRRQYGAELRGHYRGFWDSLALAKEIAMGRDIGEGKVWNELGLRYNVANVPSAWWSKIGTTPVRLLEAGDAFFKNQYYNSRIYELASVRAEQELIAGGVSRKTRADRKYYDTEYNKRLTELVNDPDAAWQRDAQAFAAKQTYTNDPNVYGGVLSALARGVANAQNRSVVVNMIVPFVRTPANLMMYSMEMIGAQQMLTPGKTYNAIMNGTQRESQEALARIAVAGGLWLAVAEAYQNGNITGTGPANWEERKVWEAAGWQPNSIKIHGKWVSVDRAAPAGQSLATIASIFDFYAMTKQQDKTVPSWVYAGMLYTADMIIDESYLSTASDFLTAISSKEEARGRSVGASMINSLLIPNLMRDIRRPADEQMRSATSTNLLDQVQKQMMNASPWHSAELPPTRDWRGEPVNYWGNAYQRAIIPFNIRDPESSDPASMALAYARIPVSQPDKFMAIPATNDKIDLFAMDNGGGYVYDKYVETVGRRRHQAVNELLNSAIWSDLVADNNIGPGSEGERALRYAMSLGTTLGRKEMLGFLIEHSGDNNTYTRPGKDGKPFIYQIHHQVSVDTYINMRDKLRRMPTPEEVDDKTPFVIEQRTEGPEFFKP